MKKLTVDPHSIPVLTLLVMGVTVAMLVFLIPNKKKVLERAFRDKDLPRIERILEEAKAKGEGEGEPLYGLLRGWLDLRKSLEARKGKLLDAEETAGLAAPFLELYGHGETAANAAEGIAETLAHSGSYDAIRDTLGAVKAKGTEAQKKKFFQEMGKFSEAAGNPLAKAFVAQEVSDGSFRDVFKVAELWQQADRQKEGLAVIEKWFADHPGKLPHGSGPVVQKYIEKLRAKNRNGEITDFLIARWDAVNEVVEGEWAAVALAQSSLACGRSAAALPTIEKWLAGHPDSGKVWAYLSDMAMGAGNLKLAVQALRNYVRLNPDDTGKKMAEAKALEWSGKPDEAFDAYKGLAAAGDRYALDRMIALAPGLHRENELTSVLPRFLPERGTNADLLLLADLRVLEGEYAQARKLYLRHLEERPDDLEVLRDLGEIDMQEHRYSEAREVFEKIVHLRPKDLEARHHLARIDWYEGKFDGLVDKLRALAYETKDEGIIQEFYSAAESLGDIPALVEATELKIATDPKVPADLYRNLTYFNTLLGRKDAALQAVLRAAEKYPDSQAFREQVVTALVADGKKLEALQALRGWVGADSSSDMKSTYISLLLYAGEGVKALDFLQNSLGPEEKKNREFVDLTAALLEDQGRHREAEQLYRTLVAEHPRNIDYHLALARTLGAQRRDREMRAVLLGIDLEKNPQLYRQVAQVYLDLEDYHEGAALLRRYVSGQAGSGDSLAWRMLGDATLSLGDAQLSKRAYRKALQLVMKEKNGI